MFSRNSDIAHVYQHMQVVKPWHKNQLVITFKSSIASLLQVKTISTTIELHVDFIIIIPPNHHMAGT